MFRDRDEELERLEKELLAQEEETHQAPEAEPEEEDYADFLSEDIGDAPAVYQNFSNNYGKDLRNFASGYKAYNSDRVDEDPEELSRKVLEEKKPVPVWVLVLLVVLIGAVVVAILWMYLSLGGMK